MEEIKVVEHTILVDNMITVSVKIPLVLNAMTFWGFLTRINSILKVTNTDIITTQADEPFTRAISEKKKNRIFITYTDEEKLFLQNLRKEGKTVGEIKAAFLEKYNKQIKRRVIAYHMSKNFEIGRHGKKTSARKSFTPEHIKSMLTLYYKENKSAPEIKDIFEEKYGMKINDYKVIYNIIYLYRKNNRPEYVEMMKSNGGKKNG